VLNPEARNKKSVAEDITLDDFPPYRRWVHIVRWVHVPKVYTSEELADLGRRAREVSKKLHEATEQLNESICTLEDTFLERLGEDARGRVEIRRGVTPIYEPRKKGRPPKKLDQREWVEFLIYKRGEFFIESNKSGPRFIETHILSTSREMRMLVCSKFGELWLACGGGPLKRGV
jgi:hypothetical protein